MSHLHSRRRSTFFWLICCSAAIYTVHYFSFSLGTHSVCPLNGGIPSREGLLCEDKGKIIEKNTLRESNTRSWWSCTGNMNYESEWHQRTCVFKNICYDKKKKIFKFYRKPGTIKTPVLFEPKLGHIYDFNINNHGFVGLVARASPQETWGPTIVEEPLPSPDEVPYLTHVHVLFMRWCVSFNPGHVIWEDIASTYFAMIRLDEYDRYAVLLEYKCYSKKGGEFNRMYENLVPAFAAKFDALDRYVDNFSSSLVCFQSVVAGGSKSMFSIDTESYKHGKERILYDYRTAILQYHGVNLSQLPTRHRILLVNKTRALRRSLRAIHNLVQVKRFIQLTYPKIQLDVINWNDFTFTQQMHELYKTTILITPCGGISMIAPFLPKGTHAIIMDFYVNSNAYWKGERYEIGESGSMDAALFNYFPHFRKLYYQVRSASDYHLDFPNASNTRFDASIIINTTRLKELIDVAIEESSISVMD